MMEHHHSMVPKIILGFITSVLFESMFAVV